MKTNTVEQAEKLRELLGDECIDFGLEPSATEEWMDGPRLTLDDLHGVFEILSSRHWPRIFEYSADPFWVIGAHTETASCDEITFHRTDNHAQDWTNILIWLIEEGHVGFEVVNDYFKNKP